MQGFKSKLPGNLGTWTGTSTGIMNALLSLEISSLHTENMQGFKSKLPGNLGMGTGTGMVNTLLCLES